MNPSSAVPQSAQPVQPVQFVLYGRSYCHLCDDMLQALQTEFAGMAFDVEVRDVDQDEAALALYDELVPVLLAQKPDGSWQQLCHYFLDKAAVAALWQPAA